MSLINSTASFQRVTSDLFKDLQFVQVYMDDIVVHSTTLSSRHDHLLHVFQRFQENAFHHNLSKCSFDADCIDFLGFQISPAGVQPLAATCWLSFHAFHFFNSHSGPPFPRAAAPARLAPHSIPSKPETNYPVTDKEGLAIISALTKWRHCLQERFYIRADHKPLVSLLSKSSTQLQDRRARWMELCMLFSFKIEHMSGEDNVVADVLSRLHEKAETSVTIASARSHQDPAETHSPAAYALALTA
ncbi:hypothetical protein Efla_002244 [Eimeria flavescens]